MQKKISIILFVFFISVVSIGISSLLTKRLQFLEDYFYSLRFPISKFRSKQIVLVIIDHNSIKKMGNYPFKRSEYAKVIAEISKGKPNVIGVDVFFDGIKDFEDDLKLIAFLDRTDTNIVLAVYPLEADNLITNKIQFSPLYRLYSYKYKNVSVGDVWIFSGSKITGITKIGAIPFIDRKYEKEYLPFPIVVASKYLKTDYRQKPLLEKGTLVAILGDIEIPLVNKKKEPTSMLINYFGGVEYFETIPFEKVVETDPCIFKNKIVLIGASAESIGDNFITPISKKTPGVVIHANAINTIINRQFISEAPLQYQIVIIFFVCLVISTLVHLLRPLTSLSVSIFVLIVYKIIVDFIFTKYRLYFLYSPLFLSVLFSYFGTFVWIRFEGILRGHSIKTIQL